MKCNVEVAKARRTCRAKDHARCYIRIGESCLVFLEPSNYPDKIKKMSYCATSGTKMLKEELERIGELSKALNGK